MINVKDADYSNRVSSTSDHTLASDGLVGPFEDTHYILPYLYDESSHEIQITSNFDGDFNFIAGVFAYENDTFWDLVRVDLTRPYRFGSADEQARANSPIFGFVPVNSCQELMTNVMIGMDYTGIVRKATNIQKLFVSSLAPRPKHEPPSSMAVLS